MEFAGIDHKKVDTAIPIQWSDKVRQLELDTNGIVWDYSNPDNNGWGKPLDVKRKIFDDIQNMILHFFDPEK
jgi:hypothetical protein